MRAFPIGVIFLIALALAGCGSARFEATEAANVHSIQLAGFDEPRYELQFRMGLKTTNESTPNTEKPFAAMLSDAGLHLGAELKTAVGEALAADGYQVTDGGADAVLSVKIGGAPPNFAPMYEAAWGGYKPEYSVLAELKDARTGKSLFHQFYVYRDNSVSPIDGTILIRPDPQYEFAWPEKIAADIKHAADGFRAPVPQIAQSVGTLLKKP
jgi:hypothetical protein